MKSESDRLVAAFRWSVIAPLAQSDLNSQEYQRKRREILESARATTSIPPAPT